MSTKIQYENGIGERAKRARHYQGCSIENRGYMWILCLYNMDIGMSFFPLTFSSAGSNFIRNFDDRAGSEFHRNFEDQLRPGQQLGNKCSYLSQVLRVRPILSKLFICWYSFCVLYLLLASEYIIAEGLFYLEYHQLDYLQRLDSNF